MASTSSQDDSTISSAPTEVDPAEQHLAAHGLISTRALARHYGITEPSIRKLMSEHDVSEVRGYPQAAALGIQRPGRHPAPGPGRGHRRRPKGETEPRD
ncbi:MAG: hypothetical protein ACRDZY_00200 [Acidimicrobiales bacterium]